MNYSTSELPAMPLNLSIAEDGVTSTFLSTAMGDNATCISYLERYNGSDTKFLEAHIPAEMYLARILPPIWWVIGIIGNIIALLVWLQPKMRHSSGYYLAALAISDLCFLPLNIVFEVNYSHHKAILDKAILCQWFAMSYMTVQYMSPVLVLAFTVERYLSVCHPFRMVKFNQSNSKVTIFVILGLAGVCLATNAVQGYFWTTDHPDTQICDLRQEVLVSNLWTIWTWTTEMLIFAAVPLAVLILNILVIIEVSNISKLERRNMRTNSIDRRSTTLMLLGVSFYQILTVLPVTVVYALYNQFPGGEPCMTDEEIAVDPTWQRYFSYSSVKIVIHNIGMSHYAANFFIYVLTGKIFRKQLYEMVVLMCCKEKLAYLKTKTVATRTTRMSLTSHRGSIAKGRLSTQVLKTTDMCNNDTEYGNKNSMYSTADLETHEASSVVLNGGTNHTPTKPNGTVGPQTRLLPCVEESEADNSDQESV